LSQIDGWLQRTLNVQIQMRRYYMQTTEVGLTKLLLLLALQKWFCSCSRVERHIIDKPLHVMTFPDILDFYLCKCGICGHKLKRIKAPICCQQQLGRDDDAVCFSFFLL
jgi:hypothetical protein